ncbi:SPOR domain-containing protein [Loktanella sp. DSM 29012]|uniref:SPOR domain-containing protein n=1 Tax=Loktanella sp. DSM 29012 TaxID=1881056 RepID=UPI000B7DA6A1|nr:SPOR domain-containing protein [Loktanella sp. DSM 29012]
MTKGLVLMAALTTGLASQVNAQTTAVPAEFPPASYTASQYVDSRGCAFVRAGMDGRVTWVPRVDRRREQLCNFQPSLARAETSPTPPQPAMQDLPIINITAEPVTPAPRAAVPAQRTAATPTPRTAPVVAPAVRQVVATPRVVTAPAPEPRRISLAQACDGRFGVQPGFVSATTRQPIDCGPVPQVAGAAPQPRAMRAPGPQRITLAQACARIANGERLVNAGGSPIACPQTAAPVRVATAQPAPVRTASTACGIANMSSDGRFPVRCGPQTESPSGMVTRSVMNPSTATISTRSEGGFGSILSEPVVPRSNPVGAITPASPPRGYAKVWDDGRINPQRGLPQARAAVQAAPQAHMSSRSVAPVTAPVTAATGHRYVQVGSFGDPDNATRLIGRLQAAGLPVASGRSGNLKVVAAGPFANASDLQRALGIVRGMGFGDAYTRG